MTAKNEPGPRTCSKCGAVFTHTHTNPRGNQCQVCRNKTKSGKRKRLPYVKRLDRPWAAANAAHTQAWYERTLGAVEAVQLTRAWSQPVGEADTLQS